MEFAAVAALAPPRLGPPGSQLTPRLRAILDQLDGIFFEEGFSQFTVGDIAARVRCSRRTLYELAPSKDELVLIVLDRRMRITGAMAASKVAETSDPAQKLEVFVSGTSELSRGSIRFREDVASFPAAQRLFADHFRYATAIIALLIDDATEQGQFRPVRSEVVAEIVDAALARFQDPEMLRRLNIDFEDAVTEIMTLLRYGLAPPASTPPRGRGPKRAGVKRRASGQ
jgi:AcrR family transcriptional regulator